MGLRQRASERERERARERARARERDVSSGCCHNAAMASTHVNCRRNNRMLPVEDLALAQQHLDQIVVGMYCSRSHVARSHGTQSPWRVCGWGRQGSASDPTRAHVRSPLAVPCARRAHARVHKHGYTFGYILSQVDAPTPASRTGIGSLTSCQCARGEPCASERAPHPGQCVP